jgi:DNA polymerase-3 subunit epsilon
MSEPHKVVPMSRIWVDTETTGLDPNKHEIIEIAILRESVLPGGGGAITESWSTKIAPARIEDADPKALEVNRYSKESWGDAPTFAAVADDIAKRLASGSVICGHNISFDVGFIEAEFKRLDRKVRMPYHKVDTVTLAYCAWNADPELPGPGLSLDKLRKFGGISMAGAHSALKDAEDARHVYYEALEAIRRQK